MFPPIPLASAGTKKMFGSKDASRIVPYFVLSHLRCTSAAAKRVLLTHSNLASRKSNNLNY